MPVAPPGETPAVVPAMLPTKVSITPRDGGWGPPGPLPPSIAFVHANGLGELVLSPPRPPRPPERIRPG